jgi:hypothetical protein
MKLIESLTNEKLFGKEHFTWAGPPMLAGIAFQLPPPLRLDD